MIGSLHSPFSFSISNRFWTNLPAFLSACLLGFVIFSPRPAAGENKPKPQYIIKLASITPEGTSWAETGHAFRKLVEEQSGGRIKVIWYLGAVMGDEPDELRKIRLGQLQGGAFTNVGLSIVAPETRILGLPFLFESYEEVDHIYEKLTDDFRPFFEKQGFLLTRWVEVGFNYWFVQKPIRSIEEFKSCRMWAWGGDQVNTEINQVLGFQNIPISLPETLSSLQTGMLNSFYGPFYAIVSLQWYTQVKYIIDLPFSYTPAAVVMNKKFMDGLPGDLQKLIQESWDRVLPQLVDIIRRDNEKAYQGFIAHGLKPYSLNDELVRTVKEKTRPIYDKFKGTIYPAWLLEKTLAALKEYRSR